MTSDLAQKALAAYGGEELWSQLGSIEAEISTKGWAFILKGRPYFKRARLFMEVHRPFCTITPVGRQTQVSGVLDGPDVRLENSRGEVIARRENARAHFTFGRRLLYWDDLDMSYFANYAFWNYFAFPALLLREEIVWKDISPHILQATFPDSLPTHSRVQRFHLDAESGLLLQHDYTADIIGRFARAANVVVRHDQRDGVPYPSRRRVTPRTGKGLPLRWPVLIEITVHDCTYLRAGQTVAES